jgi:hypothetical protein
VRPPYKGRHREVKVFDDGFECEGRLVPVFSEVLGSLLSATNQVQVMGPLRYVTKREEHRLESGPCLAVAAGVR